MFAVLQMLAAWAAMAAMSDSSGDYAGTAAGTATYGAASASETDFWATS